MAKEVNKQHHIERKRSNNGNDNYKLLKNGLAHGKKINSKRESLGNSKFDHDSNGNNNLLTARKESTAQGIPLISYNINGALQLQGSKGTNIMSNDLSLPWMIYKENHLIII